MEDRKNRKILLVDDDPFVRDMLTFILEEGGYEIVGAGDGVEALKRYREIADIDIIVTDMVMPEMDGLELVKTLRGFTPIPIILLTGRGEISTAEKALEEGATAYLLKDEEIEERIIETVEKLA